MGKLQTMVETVRDRASVRNVFGEPVVKGKRTIIPVARILFGTGGGESETDGWGGGMGGVAMPLGVYEISDDATRFIPLRRRSPGGLVLGVLLGVLVITLLRRKVAARRRPPRGQDFMI